MSFKSKFQQSVNNANPDRESLKAKYKLASEVPDTATFWNQDDLLANSKFVQVLGCTDLRTKDGSLLYQLILEGNIKVTTENPCSTGVAQIVTIPAGTFTMKFDSNTKKFSDTEVCYREYDYTRVLGTGVLTYGMKLKQQIAHKIISAVSVD